MEAPCRCNADNPMLILGLDTALGSCSVALWQDGEVLARRARLMERGHAEALFPMLAEVLAEAGKAFTDLARVGVTLGPGSFTGIRIGLAAARGIALASGIPALGVTSLKAIARAATREAGARDIFVALDTGRPEIFLQVFGPDLSERSPIEAVPPADVPARVAAGRVLIAGNARDRLDLGTGNSGIEFAAHAVLPDAADVAALVAGLPDHGDAPLTPLYIHPPYAKLPGKGAA
jgi:tRNA threonylcarbamoyladenosine biosynthesis protein TsaB